MFHKQVHVSLVDCGASPHSFVAGAKAAAVEGYVSSNKFSACGYIWG